MPKAGKRWPRPGPPGLRVLLALVFVVALLFAFPWLPEPPPGGATLARYSPVEDGASSLVETYGAEGALLSTGSQNAAVIPALKSFTQLQQGPRQALEKAYGSPEEMEDVRVVELRRRYPLLARAREAHGGEDPEAAASRPRYLPHAPDGFIEDPFSPFLGFTGVGLIAFGIVWDSLRAGFWANHGSPSLPRVSRIFLYLGYLLFSVAVINWAVTSHDILAVDFYTGKAALGGFGLFGKPLIYAIFAITLAWPAARPEDAGPTATDAGESEKREAEEPRQKPEGR